MYGLNFGYENKQSCKDSNNKEKSFSNDYHLQGI